LGVYEDVDENVDGDGYGEYEDLDWDVDGDG
jgi:hypothetical protein